MSANNVGEVFNPAASGMLRTKTQTIAREQPGSGRRIVDQMSQTIDRCVGGVAVRRLGRFTVCGMFPQFRIDLFRDRLETDGRPQGEQPTASAAGGSNRIGFVKRGVAHSRILSGQRSTQERRAWCAYQPGQRATCSGLMISRDSMVRGRGAASSRDRLDRRRRAGITPPDCQNCAVVFRATVTSSLNCRNKSQLFVSVALSAPGSSPVGLRPARRFALMPSAGRCAAGFRWQRIP